MLEAGPDSSRTDSAIRKVNRVVVPEHSYNDSVLNLCDQQFRLQPSARATLSFHLPKHPRKEIKNKTKSAAMISNNSEPSQLNGQLNSVKGQAYEQFGNVTGFKDWQTSGQKIHAEGEAEQKAAQGKALAEGFGDQISGYAVSTCTLRIDLNTIRMKETQRVGNS